ASPTMVGGIGSVGSESKFHALPGNTEWFLVDWEKPVPIDQIVLVPMIWLADPGYSAGGFPLEFRVLAGLPGDTEGIEIASFREADRLLPRSAPVVIPCQTTASWVRIEATRLSQRLNDNSHALQLAELIVFSGEENVALQGKVTSSSVSKQEGGQRHLSDLVDGYLPYVMNAPGERTMPFLSHLEFGKEGSLTIDLGSSLPISQIHLHPVESSASSPAGYETDLGIPREFVIEGANKADFSDSVVLAKRKKKSITDSGTMLMLPFPETECRYVRLTTKSTQPSNMFFAFSEIQILSKGRNIAAGKPVRIVGLEDIKRPESTTDGLNRFGRILPLKQWLGELALRHDLERRLPELWREIQRRYDQQKQNMVFLGWVILLVACAGVMSILVMQLLKTKQIAGLKNRFAADLHDELGANLHSIAILLELAERNLKTHPAGLGEIRRLVGSTAGAVRYCITKHSNPLAHDLPTDFHHLNRRILADIECELEITGEEHLQKIKAILADDLFLFYKECLMNVSRHSKATAVRIVLHATPDRIELCVEDNGRGLPAGTPPSLQRRAALLGARVESARPPGGGTRISLLLKTRRRSAPARFFERYRSQILKLWKPR
ncbi:MAG: Sensor histidine kinase LiaS, partial [Verrucomicrobiota bacterium]